MQIEISFGLWKHLTGMLENENDTYDAVITRLMAKAHGEAGATDLPESVPKSAPADSGVGAYFKDVFLPAGTELRATYKGKTYFARIIGSEWIDEGTGQRRSSPSQAAYYITGNNVNGWLFWLAKRPIDGEWHSLSALRSGYL